MKKCKKCGEAKESLHFYKHPKTKDGLDVSCKKCKKEMSNNRYSKKRLDPEFIKSERDRGRAKYKKYKYKSRSTKESQQRYKDKYTEKLKAKSACQYLEIPKGLHKHHWSYNEEHYKDVICLTNKQHSKLHRFLDYDQSVFMYRVNTDTDSFCVGTLLNTRKLHELYYLEILKLD